jgi:hypothetical protein
MNSPALSTEPLNSEYSYHFAVRRGMEIMRHPGVVD